MKKIKRCTFITGVIILSGILVFLIIYLGRKVISLPSRIFALGTYKGLINKEIDNIPDDQLIEEVMEWMWGKVKSDWENEDVIISSLPKACQDIYSVYTIDAEVNNGGFTQCYYNSSRKLTGMAELGFEAIGARGFADLMSQANTLYNQKKEELDQIPRGTVEGYLKFMESISFNQFDESFIELYKSEDIAGLCIKYIKENKEVFFEKKVI